MSDLIEVRPDDVMPRTKYIEAGSVYDEIERLTADNTFMEAAVKRAHNIEKHRDELADRIAELEIQIDRALNQRDKFASKVCLEKNDRIAELEAAAEVGIAKLEAMRHDAIKYPQLSLHYMHMDKLKRAIEILKEARGDCYHE